MSLFVTGFKDCHSHKNNLNRTCFAKIDRKAVQ